jgi:hypothetical protein
MWRRGSGFYSPIPRDCSHFAPASRRQRLTPLYQTLSFRPEAEGVKSSVALGFNYATGHFPDNEKGTDRLKQLKINGDAITEFLLGRHGSPAHTERTFAKQDCKDVPDLKPDPGEV